MKIVNMNEYSGGLEQAINYYHSKWGRECNYSFFHDAISHSSGPITGLPRFYVLIEDEKIIGCCGLIVNDFISRHDLLPWLAGIYVEKTHRGRGLGNLLMEHAEQDAKKMGFQRIYLTTDHDGYYERYGWKRIEDGFELTGEPTRIYMKLL